jgi:hypothetical protein
MTPRHFAIVLCVLAAGTGWLAPDVPPALASATTRARSASVRTPSPEAPIPVSPSDIPPIGRHLSADRVLAIADALPKLRAVRRRYRGSYGGAYLKGPLRWQVSYFSRGGREIGQAIVSDATGRVLEQWTGFQVAWSMARGYPGAFGRHVNSLYIWLPLCALFFVPFFDWRKPLRLLHLDLLVLLSLSVSLAFFNHANIGLSTPLAYPPLVYLLVRMLVLLRRHPRSSAPPLRLLVPTPWLMVGVLFLLGFRIGLNVTDANVIDVGYAGVIGAQRIAHGQALYGGYPSDNEHGDTYGPVNYEAYLPFERLFGWSGRWDDLPAAHAAAIAFDLLSLLLLFLLGRSIRGPSLGTALAYAWVSYPFTLFALESNSNDSLVAALVLVALLAARWRLGASRAHARPTPANVDAGRSTHGANPSGGQGSPASKAWSGALSALAGLTKLAPFALTPLLATDGLGGLSMGARLRRLALFALAFALAGALALLPALAHDSLHTILQRTLVYQADRESPFSIWGFYGGLGTVQALVQAGVLVLALALALLPRRSDLVGLAAACAAVLIAVQLSVNYWFYLYIPWFFVAVMPALLGSLSPGEEREAEASRSARSSLPAVAASSAPAHPSATGPPLRSRSALASG